ncbi:hypothetical protein [Bradyrhizobium sp. USDA 4486]
MIDHTSDALSRLAVSDRGIVLKPTGPAADVHSGLLRLARSFIRNRHGAARGLTDHLDH